VDDDDAEDNDEEAEIGTRIGSDPYSDESEAVNSQPKTPQEIPQALCEPFQSTMTSMLAENHAAIALLSRSS
jgi:hypothetical protein